MSEPKTIVYTYRGRIERGNSRRGYVLHDGFSATGPNGGWMYPWMTKRECQADARRQGARAVFAPRGQM